MGPISLELRRSGGEKTDDMGHKAFHSSEKSIFVVVFDVCLCSMKLNQS